MDAAHLVPINVMPETTQSVDDRVMFFVPGVPVPQGSKTGYVLGKRAIVTDSNRATLKPWRATVAEYAAESGRVFDVPVVVSLTFYLPRPQKPRFEEPGVRPDLDKLVRAVFDGLTDSGLIADDARVVRLVALKEYADPRAGVLVEVSAA